MLEKSCNEMELAGDLDSSRSIMNIELTVDALNVCAHRIDGDDQLAGNLGIGMTRNKQAQDTQFLRTQWLGQVHGWRCRLRALRSGKGTYDALKIGK